MGFSFDNPLSQSAQYKAPDPVFIVTVMALAQGFPWERFEQFFESQPLVNASALDQVFLMRVLALQEMLCLDDEEVLDWVKNQLYLFAFISPHYRPKMPSIALLVNFRNKLDELNILQPFRQRCQQMILKHGDFSTASLSDVAVSDGSDDLGSFESYLYSEVKPKAAGNKDLDLPEVEERWVTCPLCDSASLSEYVPASVRESACEPWADCQQCGHQFKIG